MNPPQQHKDHEVRCVYTKNGKQCILAETRETMRCSFHLEHSDNDSNDSDALFSGDEQQSARNTNIQWFHQKDGQTKQKDPSRTKHDNDNSTKKPSNTKNPSGMKNPSNTKRERYYIGSEHKDDTRGHEDACSRLDDEGTTPVQTAFGMFSGLSAARYGGGDSYLPARTLLHRKWSVPNMDVVMQQTIVAWTTDALRIHRPQVQKGIMKLPETVRWENAEWEREIVVSAPPEKRLSLGQPPQIINLQYHAWLWRQGPSRHGDQAFPLIGLLGHSDGIQYVPPGTLGRRGDGPLLAPGVLMPADQHFHKIDPWAGGTMEETIQLMITENQWSSEKAYEHASLLAFTSDDYLLGSDMAQVQVNGTTEVSSAIVVCVDVRDAVRPRVLVTDWLLLTTNAMVEKFTLNFQQEFGMSSINACTNERLALSTMSIRQLVCQPKKKSLTVPVSQQPKRSLTALVSQQLKHSLTALVVCHHRPIQAQSLVGLTPYPTDPNYEAIGHFVVNWFVDMAKLYFPQKNQIVFETVDILDSVQKDQGYVHHKADAWSETFTKTHKDQYPLVFMPDCGGPWYSVQLESQGTPQLEELIDAALVMVAPLGYLCVSKLLPDWIIEYLQEKYLVILSGKITYWNSAFLVIQKN